MTWELLDVISELAELDEKNGEKTKTEIPVIDKDENRQEK